MKKNFGKLNIVLFLWVLAVIINIITFLFVFYKIRPSNKTLALHYNILTGVDWYGKGKNLYVIPGVGIIVTAVNFYLYIYLKKSAVFLASLCGFVSLSVQVILLFATIFLSRVNV